MAETAERERIRSTAERDRMADTAELHDTPPFSFAYRGGLVHVERVEQCIATGRTEGCAGRAALHRAGSQNPAGEYSVPPCTEFALIFPPR